MMKKKYFIPTITVLTTEYSLPIATSITPGGKASDKFNQDDEGDVKSLGEWADIWE